MRAYWLMALTLALPASAAAAEPPPAFSGKFTVHYNPIYCVRAPCPPGDYVFSAEGRPLGSAGTIAIDPQTAADVARVIATARFSEDVAIEGELRLDPQSGAAHIHAVRALPGLWKADLPPPETEARGETPATLTVVNKTGDVVRGIYAAPASADHWGADRLDDNLAIGRRIAIALPTSDCLYDVRILLGVRPAEEIRRIDICKSATLIADKSGLIVDRRR